jgi:hypothetical protein
MEDTYEEKVLIAFVIDKEEFIVDTMRLLYKTFIKAFLRK